MTVATHALIVAVIFLCGLEETVLSHRGRCAGNQCFALFLEADNFSGAKKSCENSGGRLFEFILEEVDRTLESVLNGTSGSFWLSSANSTDSRLCSSISATMGGNITLVWTQCPGKLDGFLCQYTVDSSCSSLHIGGGERLRYVVYSGFEVEDWEMFPTGTVALAEKPGGANPVSKHVCVFGNWLQAPWKCEVMNGGCEHSCSDTTNTCMCPAGQTLHSNSFNCTKDPCAQCAQECEQEGDSYTCKCRTGYRLAQDRKSCEDVDECKEKNPPCTGQDEVCENTQGGFTCTCKDDFIYEDGVCVNVSICEKCEHMLCEKSNRVYECKCRKGFRVSPTDPTMCEEHCAERDCPARCIKDPEVKQDMQQCFCPEGYIRDTRDNKTFCTDIDECENKEQCDHKCVNTFGGYKCLCDEGHELYDDYMCVSTEPDREDNGSGSGPSNTPPVSAHPAAVPYYIKTGSVMGITLFAVLCAALLYFLCRNISKRCGRFELYSLKSGDIDIFYLQQVTTDTYKRLSFDKPFKNDSQRV